MSGVARSPATTTSSRPSGWHGLPVALADCDFASPAPHAYDIASAANFWVPPRPDSQGPEAGLDGLPRGERLLLLCDEYSLDAAARLSLLDVVAHRNVLGYETHRVRGCLQRLPGRREMWDAGSGNESLARGAWSEEHRADLRRSLA